MSHLYSIRPVIFPSFFPPMLFFLLFILSRDPFSTVYNRQIISYQWHMFRILNSKHSLGKISIQEYQLYSGNAVYYKKLLVLTRVKSLWLFSKLMNNLMRSHLRVQTASYTSSAIFSEMAHLLKRQQCNVAITMVRCYGSKLRGPIRIP